MTSDKKDAAGMLLFAAVIAAIASFLIAELCEPDMWWHLVIGNDIINSFKVPSVDRYTAAGFGRVYHDSHWLFQVLMALAHRLMGMVGVQALMVAIWSAAFFFCYRTMRRDASRAASSLLLFLVAMACAMRFLPRPEIVTFLLIPLFYYLLKEERYRSLPKLALFFLLQVVWANSHGLFVIGPFMAGCYLLATFLTGPEGKRERRPLALLTGLLLAATLVTPFGVRGWQYTLLLFQEATPGSAVTLNVGELGPVFSKLSMTAPAFWFFLLLLVLFLPAAATALARGSVSPARLAIVACLGLAALTGRRNMPLFALVAGPFLAEQLRILLPQGLPWARRLAAGAALAILAWCWFPLSGKYYQVIFTPSRFGFGVSPSYFPHALAPFLKEVGYRGTVFNSSPLGGFFLYHNYPDQLPLSDGRWEIYDRRILQAIERAPFDGALWQRLVERYDIRGVLLQHASNEARGLLPNLGAGNAWRLVYLDHAASFWVRGDLAGGIPALDLGSPAALPPTPARVEDARLLDFFLKYVGATALRLANLERMLSLGWQEGRTLEQMGALQEQLGDWPGAEKTFQRLVQLEPDNAAALSELAFLNFRRGNVAAAEPLLVRALKEEPGDKRSLELLRLVRHRLP